MIRTQEAAPRSHWTGAPFWRNLRLEQEVEFRVQAREREIAAKYEMLIRESDHRIKNSLQILASLVLVQARREVDNPAGSILQSAAARILSVARIHDALQHTGGEDIVDLGEVLESLCQALQTLSGEAHTISVLVGIKRIKVPVALAQPIALAVNELVLNSLRHGFSDHRHGTICVGVSWDDSELRIVVADNGDGMPTLQDKVRGFGMKLVRSLVRQIGGELAIESDDGARFTITARTDAAAA